MANDTTVKLNITSGASLDKEIDKAKELRNTLLEASKALRAAAGDAPRRSSAAAAAPTAERGTTGLARSIGTDAGTGSGARDFAKQASGLGGVVRLYATFAANIFAVSAAFTALSNAADTTNLIKGLDQLGAAAGRNLGGLSKEFARATDNAISLKEASIAVAKASSSGLGSENILKIATVAKTASQALGVDMTDAVSRLTRGITKLEPELLDELGIFTRVDKASQDYAKSIGKSALSLTDFEKRQAFANAVLAEGEKKFGALKVDSNPYSKLAASFSDLTSKGLELVNKVLGPIAELLSKSPVALAAAIVGIATVLLKQALPAVGQIRDQLKLNAQAAVDTAKKFENSFDDKFQAKLASRFKIPDLEKDLLKAETALAKLAREPAAKTPASLVKLKTVSTLVSDPENETNLKRVITLMDRKQAQLDTNLRGTKQLNAAQRTQATEEIEFLGKEIAKAKEITAAINARTNAQKALNNANQLAESRAGQPIGRLDPEIIAGKKLKNLQSKADRSQIISNVAESTSIIGIKDSMALLNKEIAEKGITGWNKWSTVAKGAVVSVFTRVSGIISAFSGVGSVIAGAVAAFQVLDTIFTKNSKQAAVFNDSLESVESSVKNVKATLATIAEKDPLNRLSVESTQARANAMLDLSNSVAKAVSSFYEVDKAAGIWDAGWDKIFSVFGKGNFDKLKTSFTEGLINSIELMDEGDAKEEALKKIASILNVDTSKLTSAGISSALSTISQEKAIGVIKQAVPELKKITTEYNNSAAAGTRYTESLKLTSKLLAENTASLKATDLQSKLGEQLIEQAKSLGEALGDPVKQLNLLVETAQDIQSLSLLPKGTALELAKSNEASKALLVQYSALSTRIKEVEQEKAKVGPIDLSGSSSKNKNEITRLENLLKALKSNLSVVNQSIVDESGRAAELVTQKFLKGLDLLNKGLEKANKQAKLEYDKSKLGAAQSVGLSNAEEDIRIRKEEIKLTLQDLEAKFANTIAVEELTAQIALDRADRNLKEAKTLGTGVEKAQKDYDIAKAVTDAMKLSTRELFSKLENMPKSGPGLDSASAIALRSMTSFITSTRGRDTAAASAKGQLKFLENIGAGELRASQQLSDEKTRLDLAKERAKVDSDTLNIYTTTLGIVTELSIANEARLKEEDAIRVNSAKVLDIQRKLDTADRTNTARPEQLEALEKELAILKDGLVAQKEGIRIKKDLDTATLKQGKINTELDDQLTREEQLRKTKSGLLDIEISRLNFMSSIGDKGAAIAIQELEIARQKLEVESQLSAIEKSRRSEVAPIAGKLESLANAPKTAENIQAIKDLKDQQAAVEARYSAEKTAILSLSSTKEAQSAQLLEYNKSLLAITTTGEILSNIFGKVGETFQSVATAMLNMSVANKTYAQEAINNTLAQATAQDTLNAARLGGDPKDVADSEKALNKVKADGIKIQDKSTNNQLDGYASILGAIKKNAGEQSRTAQVIGKIEKAVHIAKMAMLARDQIATLTNNATTISGALAAAGANSVKAITAAFAAPFPVGFVAGAAMIAIMSSLLGGKSKKPPVNFSAESQQAVQGTGQQYDASGNIVSRAGGALGDNTAVAKSLDDSIKIIEEHSFKNLEYSNKMLDNLKSIKNNTAGLTAALLQAGFNIKGRSGIQEGTTMGKTEDRGGIFKVVGSDTGIGRAIGKLSNAIFGGKTKVEIQDTGIAIKGTLDQLTKGAKGFAEQYTNVKTTVSGGLFKSNKTNYETFKDNLSDPVNRAISDTFRSIKDTVMSASEALGADSGLVKSIVDNFDIAVKVSAQGLKPDELAAAITAELSVAFNSVAEKAFPELQQFRKGGEEMGATIVRLARDMQVTNLSLESAGLSLSKIGSMVDRVGATQSLIELSGGMEQFLSKTEFFKDNFLSSAEKLAPVQKRVTDEMKRLGFSAVDTRQEFADLVRSLDLNTQYGQETYAALTNVASGFAEVYPETRKLLSAQELSNQQRNQSIEILKLEGRATEALALSRAEELAQLDPALVEGKKYIYQLQDRLALIRAEAELLSVSGRSSEALMLTREMELRNLTDTERQLKKSVFLAQDYAKTQALSIQIMEAEGFTLEATTAKRQLELDNLSATDAALQARIYQLQDEKKLLDAKIAQEEKIYTLTNRASEALASTRERELDAIDELLQPSQLYIYALEDEATLKDKLKTAYDKASSAIKSTIDKLQSSIKVLKEYRASLATGADSLLSPAEKYAALKKQAADVAAIATGIATTDAGIKAKDEAIAKLPEVSSAFLEASRTIFASSDQYSADLASVLSTLDATSSALDAQLTDAEQQLSVLEQNTTILDLIRENTLSTSELLAEYLTIQSQFIEQQSVTASARDAAAAGGSYAAGGSFSVGAVELLAQTLLPENLKIIFDTASAQIVEPTLNIQTSIATYTQKTAETAQLSLVELKSIVAELQTLREQAAQQTADAALLNKVATDEAANTIVETIEEVIGNADWYARNVNNRD